MTINTKSKNLVPLISQSAGNLAGSSETIRELSESEKDWLAGVLDGDGNFDVQTIKKGREVRLINAPLNIHTYRALKQIRITQHPRDSRVLARVQSLLGGSVRPKGGKYIIWTISTKHLMTNCLNLINGRIRVKVPGFQESCKLMGVNYIKANYTIPENSAYLAGLIDTDGSVVLNFQRNVIEVVLEFNQNEFTEALDFSKVIPNSKVSTLKLIKRNQTKDKEFFSIRFSYNRVGDMQLIYNYVCLNRLYSDFKFYRAMKIKRFLEIRPFKSYPKNTPEFKLFSEFVVEFFTHLNESKGVPILIRDQIMI